MSRHYRLHKNWTFDPSTNEGTHHCGMVVRFVRCDEGQPHPRADLVILVWGADGKRWAGSIVHAPDEMSAWFARQVERGVLRADQSRIWLATLLSEAGERFSFGDWSRKPTDLQRVA
ncbi:MAG: hypothetical protein REI94_10210 [Moraxellaceae bacterium]|nr:hypothetical protein [Moraxellaceae bacterium]